MACYHDSMSSSIGNTSMSSFLSTLMENEEISDFKIVVDNCKPDHSNSCTSLTLLEKEQPKCRWNDLVRSDSDLSLGSGRRSASDLSLSGSRRSRSRLNRLSINRPSMKSNRSISDPSLDLPMPRRIQSPTKTSPQSRQKLCNFHSDTQLLRMPQRRPSPTPQTKKTLTRSGSRSGSMNVSWNASEVKDSGEKKNPFLDIVAKTNDLASKSNMFQPSSPCKPLKQSCKATLAKQMLAIDGI